MNTLKVVLVAIFVFLSFAVVKAEAIDIYTFKKDRVDQELRGNRGYLFGKPKDIPEVKRNLKRTLIGIDIEIGAIVTPLKTETSSETRNERQVEEVKVTVVEEEWIK